MIVLVSVAATLALLAVATIVGSLVGTRSARRYRRKDARDVVHTWVNRSGRR